jgi:hypothetical protein
VQIELDELRVANQKLVDSRLALGQDTSVFYGVSWVKKWQIWAATLRYGGRKHFLAHCHDEKEASLVVDEALNHIGAGERCNWLEGKPTGYGGGVEAQAHKIAGLLRGRDELKETDWIGVSENKDPRLKSGTAGWRARLNLAHCRWESKNKPFPSPCAVTLRAKNPEQCKCKRKQHWFGHPSGGCYKTAEEAARRYNEVVRLYGYDKPPYNQPLNPPAGVAWTFTSGT